MPVVRRSRRGSASRRTARMPQWASLHAGAEEEVEDAAEHGVADVAVQPRHRARLDVASCGRPSRGRRRRRAPRRSAGCRRSRRSGRRRPSRCSRPRRRRSRPGRRCRSRGAARARPARRRRLRELGAAVLRAVVGDDHLAVPALALERGRARAHAALDRGCLVEAGDHDRDLDGSAALGRRCWADVLSARRCSGESASNGSVSESRTRRRPGSRAFARRW